MTLLRYTLLSDGSSDAALMPIIESVISEHRPDLAILGQAAGQLLTRDLSLRSRIPAALAKYPCDALFVHRDAEGQALALRHREIVAASVGLKTPVIPVIPIRMTEAWMLSDENAIRFAAENRSGSIKLKIPAKNNWETLPDPKRILFDLLKEASGKQGRALDKFNPHKQRALVTQWMSDFSGLR
ncbi:MAG: hypothetical protein ABW202_20860 [Duganella sp.]